MRTVHRRCPTRLPKQLRPPPRPRRSRQRLEPVIVYQAVTYTASVTATSPSTGLPSGNVEFFDGGTAIGGCAGQALSVTSPDTATCVVTYTATGSHTITAQYLGASGSYTASAVSAAITQTVNKASTATALGSNNVDGYNGNPVTYTATVTVTSLGSGTPPATDTVEFYDNGTAITGCTAQPLSGTSPDTATCTVTYTSTRRGTNHSITAVFNGDSNYLTSMSLFYTESE